VLSMLPQCLSFLVPSTPRPVPVLCDLFLGGLAPARTLSVSLRRGWCSSVSRTKRGPRGMGM
jgi:hypothetical protein